MQDATNVSDQAVDQTPVTPQPIHSDVSNYTVGTTPSETLEDQNIFEMLGVQDGDDDRREAFLDELQNAIWEDFLENDIQLLLSPEAYAEFTQIRARQSDTAALESQEELLQFLENHVTTLDEIMLEKALGLKADLFQERVRNLKDLYATPQDDAGQDAHRRVLEAERLMSEEKWNSASQAISGL
jgi:hypothetical protein